MHRIIFTIFMFLIALRAEAAMVRVVAIENGRTLTIERNGTRSSVVLAGVGITDELRARELLRWTIGTSWVMLEPSGDGFLAYRSPDALFINRELVLRGCARATLPGIQPAHQLDVTYLGQLHPEGRPPKTAAKERGSGSGTSRRSRAQTKRATGAGTRAASGAKGSAAPAPSSGARTRGRPPQGSSR